MMHSDQSYEQLLNQFEYASHWVSLDSLLAKCLPKKPFVKLRKFDESKFTRRHEMTINHLYFQKLYLICMAIEYNAKLQLSQSYYEDNGLIFGVYDLSAKDAPPKRITGIALKQEVEAEEGPDRFYDIVQENSQKFFDYIKNLKFNPKDEYEQWSRSLSQIFSFNIEIKPRAFIKQFERLPLAQHYVFNVKVRNSMLLPKVLADKDMSYRHLSLVRMERSHIDEYLISGDVQDLMPKIQAILKEMYTSLQARGRISQLTLNYVQPTKGKSKQANELRIQAKFLIILCPSRGNAEVNETANQDPDHKDKGLTKIQIKPQNGSLAPVSGNLINVNLSWDFFLESKSYRLKLQCFNNRKLEQMYYDELMEFWHSLEGSEQFRDIIGIDKYLMLLSEKKTKEVVFMNYIPGCLPTDSIKEVDKIVSLAIAMDEAIEICERKGFEHEDPTNFQVTPFMVTHARQRFKLALAQIDKNYMLLRDQNRQMRDE